MVVGLNWVEDVGVGAKLVIMAIKALERAVNHIEKQEKMKLDELMPLRISLVQSWILSLL